jgi:hypothetical protein
MVMSSSACCYYAPSSNGIGDIICVRSYCDRSYKIVPTALKTLIPNNLTPSACGIPPPRASLETTTPSQTIPHMPSFVDLLLD